MPRKQSFTCQLFFVLSGSSILGFLFLFEVYLSALLMVHMPKQGLLMKKLLVIFFLLLSAFQLWAQTCDGPGQKPSKAFPVCGTSVFRQTTVPLCSGLSLPSPACRNSGAIADVNPYWYKFTCFKSGTLGFTITPNQLSDDYDWELYDVTGRNPDDIYSDGSLVVSCNWSGEGGKTGAGTSGRKLMVCAGYGQDLYSGMAQLREGHNYLLLISHFTQSQSGYDLAFGGGTAVITDTLTPHLKTAEASCSGDVIRLKLNKGIRCNSIAADGSEFYLSASATSVISTVGANCSGGFDSDSLIIKLNTPLAPGTYQLNIKKGRDGNTLLDYCDKPIPETDAVSFTVLPLLPTPMDHMAAVKCSPKEVRLLFRKPISCASIAANGSDFIINGTYPVSVLKAEGICTEGSTREIIVSFDRPLQDKGDFILTLRTGSDGNTLLDECAQETPTGSSLPFSVKDTVNADFTYTIEYGCTRDIVRFSHPGGNEINDWEWTLDESKSSTLQNPEAVYTVFNQKKNIRLFVSNGFCSDTAKTVLTLENYLKADFSVVPDNCPFEPVEFTSTAIGKITQHSWSFGDGFGATEMSPKHIYQQPAATTSFLVKYTVRDSFNCEQTITKPIKIYSSCTVYVPNAFSPGNDGRNDFFRVLNAVKADKFALKIFNRWGQLLYQSSDWKQGWDGKYKGQLQSTGTYIWMLRYVDSRNNSVVERKGSFVLIR